MVTMAEVKNLFKELIKEYGDGQRLFTFDACSDGGAEIDNSTIDEIVTNGDDIIFFYNVNEKDYCYAESFSIDELENFYEQLKLFYAERIQK